MAGESTARELPGVALRISAGHAFRTCDFLTAELSSRTVRRVAAVITMAVWCAVVAYAVPHHEPWADEAQAWMLAKTLSFSQLFGRYLHYEFSPGLWHGVLWLLARLHASYAGMHWAAAGIALSGIALLVFSKLPFALRLVLPFTYFLAYQYAVVARSYVLLGPLLFALARLWPQRWRWPLLVACLLGAVANVCAHGLAISMGLAVVLALEWWKLRLAGPDRSRDRAALAGAVLVLLLFGFAVWCILPPSDSTWFRSLRATNTHDVTDASRHYLSSYTFSWLPHALATPVRAVFHLAGLLSLGLSQPHTLGVIAWVLLTWRCWSGKKLRYLFPVISLSALAEVSRFSFYHAGTVWLLFLFLFWVTGEPGRASKKVAWVEVPLMLVVLLCAISQVVWTAKAVTYDAKNLYSPDRDGAKVLQAYLDQGQQVDVAVPPPKPHTDFGEFFVTGMEPYFTNEPLANMRARFWIWKGDQDMRDRYLADTQSRSVVVVVEAIDTDERWPPEVARLKALGYTHARSVCGKVFYPFDLSRVSCHAFYEPPPTARLSGMEAN
jgi:hypothetical protein